MERATKQTTTENHGSTFKAFTQALEKRMKSVVGCLLYTSPSPRDH
jgi:hypothetical protein